MPGLGVNIDHVATVRQARLATEPDPVWAAVQAELGGAECITFHLRQDRRHINDRDAQLLRQTCAAKVNMEMSLAEEIIALALEIRPAQATLVPENRQEVTTEGGLDVAGRGEAVAAATARLQQAGIEVSAFIDPEPAQVAAAKACGADAVELHTGRYANARGAREVDEAVGQIAGAVEAALGHGLVVHGGHGLNYRNIHRIAAIPGFCEFNIGHSIISRALMVGMAEAVREMKRLIDRAAGGASSSDER